MMPAGIDESALVLGAVAAAAFLLGTIAQAVSGFGGALVAVPILALVTDAGLAVVASTVIGIATALVGYSADRSHADVRAARRLIGYGALGMPVGILVLTVVDERTLSVVVATVVLLLTAAIAVRRSDAPGPRDSVSGFVSGALLTSTGFNGPPLAMHLLGRPPRAYRATLQGVFVVQDCLAVLFFAAFGHLSWAVLGVATVGLLVVPIGWWLGDHIFRRLDRATARLAVLAMLFAAGSTLLATSLT